MTTQEVFLKATLTVMSGRVAIPITFANDPTALRFNIGTAHSQVTKLRRSF